MIESTNDNNVISLMKVDIISPLTIEQIEDNKFKECYLQWDFLRSDRIAPQQIGIDLLQFPLSLAPSCSIIHVEGPEEDFSFRYWGSHLTKITNLDMTDKKAIHFPVYEEVHRFLAQYNEVKESKSPSLYTLHQITQDHDEAIETVLRLPLSNDGINVDHVLSFSDMGNNPFVFA